MTSPLCVCELDKSTNLFPRSSPEQSNMAVVLDDWRDDGWRLGFASCTEHQDCTRQSEAGLWCQTQESEPRDHEESQKVRREHNTQSGWSSKGCSGSFPVGRSTDSACTGQIPLSKALSWGCSGQLPIGCSIDRSLYTKPQTRIIMTKRSRFYMILIYYSLFKFNQSLNFLILY